ncbi:cytosol aminopeptidase-like [Onthophagus taurus]|uniref:cytosol aminopeptidase-like n=1 Tax=Onthophagus taurus TaxID=166361 RepID=UPI000C2053CA|nr:cytosol aminopeptidase-like [Onthophagus taurus]
MKMSVILAGLRRKYHITFRYVVRTLGGVRNFSAEGTGQCDDKKGLIVGVYHNEETAEPCFTPSGQKYNDKLNGKLFDLVKAAGGEIRRGGARVFNNIDNEFWSVAVVGLGNEKLGYNEQEAIDEGLEATRVAAGIGAQRLLSEGVKRIMIEGLGHPEQAAEGSALALWRYQDNKSRDQWIQIPTLELFDEPDAESFQRGLFKAECQNLARRLSDTPANQMTPLHFAQEAVNELCPCGIKVEVHDRDWIEMKKMAAFMAVARGSCEPPIFLEISYCGGPPDQKPFLIVGKGITFDSGGLCIKTCAGMDIYRADMCGAACIVGAIRAAAALSLPININCCIPLCENMPSGMAMKCGDLVMGLNGKSIMIEDTDNEGRLIMADALVYGQSQYKPRLIIDLASLTPGIRSALGASASGVFCNSQTMWSQVRKAGVITGDRVWRMPLWKFYTRKVTDYHSHDVNNRGWGYGDPCLGAAFLNEFVNCVDWIHFDITGVGMLCHEKVYPYLTSGRMTGRPTRTLIQLLYQLACPQPEK